VVSSVEGNVEAGHLAAAPAPGHRAHPTGVPGEPDHVVSPSVAAEVALIVSEDGFTSYALPTASRPSFGPAGTAARLITGRRLRERLQLIDSSTSDPDDR
jgi:hypothetical protein